MRYSISCFLLEVGRVCFSVWLLSMFRSCLTGYFSDLSAMKGTIAVTRVSESSHRLRKLSRPGTKDASSMQVLSLVEQVLPRIRNCVVDRTNRKLKLFDFPWQAPQITACRNSSDSGSRFGRLASNPQILQEYFQWAEVGER